MLNVSAPITAYSLPDDETLAIAAWLGQIQAVRTIYRGRFFGFTDKTFADALLDAHHRGVDCKLILDHLQEVAHVEAALVHYMLANGFPAERVTICTSIHHQFSHDKGAAYDGATWQTGSTNCTAVAFEQDNALLFIQSPELTADFVERFERQFAWARAAEAKYQPAAAA